MIIAHPSHQAQVQARSAADLEQAVWLDLVSPTPDEMALVAEATGLRVPTREDLDEIESSSRQYRDGEVVYLSMNLMRRVEHGIFKGPIGFVLSRDRLITVRYTDYPVFETFGARLAKGEENVEHPGELSGSAGLLIGLIEAIVDRLADLLEHAGDELDTMSRRIFHVDAVRKRERSERQHDRSMRLTLAQIGHMGGLISATRDSLLGVQRIVGYLPDNVYPGCPASIGQRLKTIQRDINSLNDYENQSAGKVQFLLDATLGFINIDQNGGLRVLTVVSFIGVLPTLVASIYGMNFKDIPELNWTYGYFYALGLMATTVTVPMLWFWRKGWLSGR